VWCGDSGDAGFFGEGLAPVGVNFRYGYIDKRGKLLLNLNLTTPISSQKASPVARMWSKNMALSTRPAKSSLKYDLSFPFHSGLAPVGTGNWHSEDPRAEEPHGFPVFCGNWSYIYREGHKVWQSSN
jgi:hypothetical protein